MDSREQLEVAHERIAHLEARLARLKRGFDPEPLANPISEEEHHRNLALAGGQRSAPLFVPVYLIVSLATIGFFMVGVIFLVTRAPATATLPTIAPTSGTSP